jgi:hypothetical protein
MQFRMDLTGLPALRHLVTSAPHDLPPLVDQGLREEADVIFAKSQEIVPVRWGHLKGSGMVSEPKHEGGRTYVEITYGGPAAKYAMWVHEKRTYANGEPYTRGKYLQRPVEERAPQVAQNVARRIESMLRKALEG